MHATKTKQQLFVSMDPQQMVEGMPLLTVARLEMNRSHCHSEICLIYIAPLQTDQLFAQPDYIRPL